MKPNYHVDPPAPACRGAFFVSSIPGAAAQHGSAQRIPHSKTHGRALNQHTKTIQFTHHYQYQVQILKKITWNPKDIQKNMSVR